MTMYFVILALLFLLVGGGLKMAGGNAADIRAPYPKGEGSVVEITLGPADVATGKTDHLVDQWQAPFAFRVQYVHFTAELCTLDTGISVHIFDDSATPLVIVNDDELEAIVAGATDLQKLAVVSLTQVFNAGALITLSITTDGGGSEVLTNGKIRMGVVPVY